MVYKIKSPARRQFKEPDEFISLFGHMVVYAKKHTKQLAVSIGVAVLIAAAVVGFFMLEDYSNRQAQALENEAFGYYQGSLPATRQDGKPEPDYQKALERYQKIVEEYPRSSNAMLAQYYIGNSYFELKNYDEAAKTYQKFLEKYSGNQDLTALVYQRLGYTKMMQGKNQEAVDSFKKVAGMRGTRTQDQALFELGRLYEKMGQQKEAIEQYQTLAKDYTKSPFAIEARVRLKSLGGEVPAEAVKAPVQLPVNIVPAAKEKGSGPEGSKK